MSRSMIPLPRWMAFGKWSLCPFVVFAYIDEKELLLAVELCLHVVDGGLADTLLGVVHHFQKSGRVLVCHADMIARAKT